MTDKESVAAIEQLSQDRVFITGLADAIALAVEYRRELRATEERKAKAPKTRTSNWVQWFVTVWKTFRLKIGWFFVGFTAKDC